MSTITKTPFACTKNNFAAIASVKVVMKYERVYEEVAEELGANCRIKIATTSLGILENIESMCQSRYQDEALAKKTSAMIDEMREQSANCISSEVAKKQQTQEDTADKIKKMLKESALDFSPITPGAYSLISAEIPQQKTSTPSQKEPETFHFPSQNVLETCLKQHPAISDVLYFSDKEIIQEAAKNFANSERYKTGIQLGAVGTISDLNEKLKLSDIGMSTLDAILTTALEDCTIESERSKK